LSKFFLGAAVGEAPFSISSGLDEELSQVLFFAACLSPPFLEAIFSSGGAGAKSISRLERASPLDPTRAPLLDHFPVLLPL